MELDNEGVSNLLHDVTLNLGVVNLIRPNDKVFFQRLNSVDLSSVLLTGHVYFAEGASPNNLEQRKILHFQTGLIWFQQSLVHRRVVTVA